MSRYTTQVRWIVEEKTPLSKGLPIQERIREACPKIFNFTYPIWREDYRRELETKILKHYITKEIGFETVGLWQLFLDERLNLIMPYYNQLYETIVMDYDPLVDTKTREQYQGERDEKRFQEQDTEASTKGRTSDTGSATSHTDGVGYHNERGNQNGRTITDTTGKNLGSDLPQANYAGLDYGTNLTETEGNTNTQNLNDTSGSGDTHNTTHNEGSNTSTGAVDTDTKGSSVTDVKANTIDGHTILREGNYKHSLTDLLNEYRDSLINIDRLIINELSDLFMMIY